MKKLLVLLLFLWFEGKAQLPVSVGKPDVSSLLTQLVGGIKPSSFISSFAGQKDNWLSNITNTMNVPDLAKNIVSLASGFNIDAQIIGRVEESEKKELVIEANGDKLLF